MTQAINKSMNLLEWAMILALSVLWGGSFFFVGVAVGELPPFTIVALRVGLAALALHLVLRVLGERMPTNGGLWRAFFAMGFLNNLVPFTLIVWSQTHIASGLASILNSTTPLFAVVVAHIFTDDERLSGERLVGVLVGFAGVVVMIGPELLEGLGTNVAAQGAVLLASFFYALSGVYGRRFRRLGVSPLVTATGQVTASSVMLLPLAMAVEQPWGLMLPGLETWSALVGLAVFSTSLAYILYFRILATAGATNILLVTFLVPVSAILLGTAFLGELLQAKHFLGMALIGAGLVAIDGRLPRMLVQRSSS